MKAQEAKLTRCGRAGRHSCGAQWGFMGDHAAFSSVYECPCCGAFLTVSQCSAWPITEKDCDDCGALLAFSLDEKNTGCALR